MIIWFTGQPGSGKTTIAREMLQRCCVDFVLDGDDLRRLYSNYGKNIGGAQYGERDRHANVARAQDIALYLHDQGLVIAVALVSPYIAQREDMKKLVGLDNFKEIFLQSNRELRREYHAADYQEPTGDCLWINTDRFDIDACVEQVNDYMDE